jgi:predicted esterase
MQQRRFLCPLAHARGSVCSVVCACAFLACSSDDAAPWQPAGEGSDASTPDVADTAVADIAPEAKSEASAEAGAEASPEAAPDATVDPALTDRSKCTAAPDKKGVTDRKITAGGMTYVGFAPSSYDPAKPMSMVLSLHGAGDTAGNYFSIIWQGNAETRGFLVLSPEGTSPNGSGFTYMTSDLDPIVNDMVEDFAHCYTIDPKRRIMHGFSAGGILAYLVGFEAADFFAGIAISSADFNTAEYYAGGGLLPAAWKIPVSHTHGLSDQNFPIDAARSGRDKILAAGHKVYWHEFDGGHTTTPAYALQMYDDLAGSVAP